MNVLLKTWAIEALPFRACLSAIQGLTGGGERLIIQILMGLISCRNACTQCIMCAEVSGSYVIVKPNE